MGSQSRRVEQVLVSVPGPELLIGICCIPGKTSDTRSPALCNLNCRSNANAEEGMEGAIDADVSIPWTILSAVLVYTTLYFILATLLGLLLFEDRDLA